MNRMAVQRTDWAEEFVAKFLSLPLGCADREVCDVLFAHRRAAVVVLMKTQADPTVRRGDALEAWCSKHSRPG
jgi:hypothetical protein